MENEFVPYELAVKLKELGFDEPCMSSKDMNNSKGLIQLPLYQQAFRWFREKHEVFGIVNFGTNDFTFNIYNSDGLGLLTKESLAFNGAYEEAELACLTRLIEIVEQYKN